MQPHQSLPQQHDQDHRLGMRWRVSIVLGLLVALAPAAQATCSRIINTPVAPTGQSVTIDGDTIGGIYPEVLRSVQSKETCLFALSAVPRARLELLFETGKADVLLPASKTARRDALGIFVQMSYSRPALISLSSERPAIKTLKELIDARNLKVALVRGFDYGPAYKELADALDKQGRLILQSDPLGVARLLKSGAAHATVMASTILVGTLRDDERVRGMADKLRYEPLEDLPWSNNGVYISKTSLSEVDRQALVEFFERIAKSGAVWKGFQQAYEPDVLNVGMKSL